MDEEARVRAEALHAALRELLITQNEAAIQGLGIQGLVAVGLVDHKGEALGVTIVYATPEVGIPQVLDLTHEQLVSTARLYHAAQRKEEERSQIIVPANANKH